MGSKTTSASRIMAFNPSGPSCEVVAIDNNVSQPPKGGVTKWKNKLKSFLTSPLPNSNTKPLSPPLIKTQDIYIGDLSSYEHDSVGNDSYEARLSRLVGDLENVDYGATADKGPQWNDGNITFESHPFAFAATPTNFSDCQPPANTQETLNPFPPSLGEYLSYPAYDDIQVSSLYQAPTSPFSIQPTTIALSAVESHSNNVENRTNSATIPINEQSQSTTGREVLDKSRNTQHNVLFPGDGPSIPVPFNSPADGTTFAEASMASLSMPFTFEELKNMGLIEGGALDIGGGADEYDLAKLLDSSQMNSGRISAEDSKDSILDLSHFDLSLFPAPNFVFSPKSEASSGPSPALSYGESSTSNTSFEDGHVDPAVASRYSHAQMHGLFIEKPSLAKTPSHSPKPSISSSIPPTPSSHKSAGSVPPSPFRRPVVHASALTWRVAPTVISPQTNIAIDSRPPRTIPSVPSFVNNDPFAGTGASRLTRLHTASSPELKRRWNEDEGDLSSSGLIHRLSSYGQNDTHTAPSLLQDPMTRPIAGRRRVGIQMALPMGPKRSTSHQQLYQPSEPTIPPTFPATRSSWSSDNNHLNNFYTQLDTSPNYLCMLQGCNRTFGTEFEVRTHVQTHFVAPAQRQQQRQYQYQPSQMQHQHQRHYIPLMQQHDLQQSAWI